MRKRFALMATVTVFGAAGALVPAATAASAPASSAPDPREIGRRALSALASRPAQVRSGPGQEFQVTRVTVDPDGTSHTRMARTFRGLPVLGGDLVVHQAPAGETKGVSMTLAQAPAEAEPRIAQATAEQKAVPRDRRLREGTRLVVEARTPDHRPRLAWRIQTQGMRADGTPSHVLTSVDALTGKILLREETVHTEAGEGRSLYAGTVPLQTTRSGSSFQLKDPTRGNGFTGDAQNRTDRCGLFICWSQAPNTVFTDADNRWGSGTTSDRATVAVDVQYGTAVTWDFYKNVLGRNGIAGDGKGSYARVHYGSRYANAFWSDQCFCMTFGDGDGTTMGPLTSIDVVAHEMTHGVTSRTAGLVYSGESGGLNEATSDIIAATIEFHVNNPADPGDYLIGEKLPVPGSSLRALRFMDRPGRDGRSADYWSSNVAQLDVHLSSGVANHFFYLLAEGSGAKTINGVAYDSPTANGSTVTGIGRDAAVRIWFRALTTYMTSATDYKGARTATLNAARDLYGQGGAQYNAVAAAWTAVNVR